MQTAVTEPRRPAAKDVPETAPAPRRVPDWRDVAGSMQRVIAHTSRVHRQLAEAARLSAFEAEAARLSAFEAEAARRIAGQNHAISLIARDIQTDALTQARVHRPEPTAAGDAALASRAREMRQALAELVDAITFGRGVREHDVGLCTAVHQAAKLLEETAD